MSQPAAEKLNNYNRLPLGLLQKSRGLTKSTVFVLSDVFSFTGEELTCMRTYKSFQNGCGVSRSTVSRALRRGKDSKFIATDKEKGYIFIDGSITGELFLKIEKWVHTEEFQIRKVRRRLTKSERLVYARIFTSCNNEKRTTKYCVYSNSELAVELSLSEKTVQRAIWTLLRAGLIYRPQQDKGVNGYIKSTYTLNNKLIRELRKKTDKNSKTEPSEAVQTSKPAEYKSRTEDGRERRAAIERIYAQRRHKAEQAADDNLARARRYKPFIEAEKTLNRLSVDIAFAELREPEKVLKLNIDMQRARRERNAAMRALGLTEEDLKPQYACRLCNDTGFKLSNGRVCKCFPPGKA